MGQEGLFVLEGLKLQLQGDSYHKPWYQLAVLAVSINGVPWRREMEFPLACSELLPVNTRRS